MQVTTPVEISRSGSVLPGSHVVGGNIGTQVSPCSSVNGPHFAAATVWLDATHAPSRSVVPAPQSTLLHPATSAVSSARKTIRVDMGPPRSGRRPHRDR